MNTKIQGNFQTCISVPLIAFSNQFMLHFIILWDSFNESMILSFLMFFFNFLSTIWFI